jgi:hypothetical protein
MQVFLPENNFVKCAEVLDYRRLVKQLLEGRQIMTILAGQSASKGWVNHPAVKMFKGHERTLYSYLFAIKDEMQKRGYKWENNWNVIQDTYMDNFISEPQSLPEWMEDQKIFAKVINTHRGRLWEKDPIHYEQYIENGKTFMKDVCCPGKCTYYWATHMSNKVV